ncbi:hypothetical protein GCM10020220_091460 [Nonomuraea rubra]
MDIHTDKDFTAFMQPPSAHGTGSERSKRGSDVSHVTLRGMQKSHGRRAAWRPLWSHTALAGGRGRVAGYFLAWTTGC